MGTPFEPLILASARNYGISPAVVAALCEQESAFEPAAIRYEPAFYERYVVPLKLASSTEAHARAFSWGVMQVMGQVAREAGFKGKYLSELCQPNVGIDIGCKVFKRKFDKANGDLHKALLLWNGGGRPEYADEVKARLPRFQHLEAAA